MSDLRSFDDRLNTWLREGPDAAPPDLIGVIVEQVSSMGSGRRIGRLSVPKWDQTPRSYRLLFAGASFVAILLIASLVLVPRRSPSVGIPSAPSSSPTDRSTSVPPSLSPTPSFAFDPCVASRNLVISDSRPGFDSARVRGRIAFRDRRGIVAIDPAHPDEIVAIDALLKADPRSWSPDGTRLLVVVLPEVSRVGSPGAAVLGSDGSASPLTDWGTGWFSPDGNSVVYAVPGGGLCLASPDGSSRKLLAFDMSEPFDESPTWSPDGSQIAFLDFVEDSPVFGHHAYGLSFIDADGSNLRQLVVRLPGEEGHGGLTWSPDGSRLTFWHLASGRPQIFIVDADGTGLRQITTEGSNQWPAWSPDGSRIGFVRDGVLSTMMPDGSDIHPLTDVKPLGSIAWNPAR
jgi:WD40-like Beta Propeller Repeat